MKVVLLFPGQGSQKEGFLHALPSHPAVEATLAEASTALDCDALMLDSEESLRQSENVQLSLVIAGVAFSRVLYAEGIQAVAMAGHSVGAFAAAVGAESIAMADALRMVRLRAQLMQRYDPPGYGMMAIDGLPRSMVEGLLTGSELHMAVLNGPRRFVLAGTQEHLELIGRLAEIAGATRAVMLAVPVASHHPLLGAAADDLARETDSIPIAAPSTALMSNRNARPLRTSDGVREDLIYNMVAPVRWGEMLQALLSFAPQAFVEVPPGHVLTRIVKEDLSGQTALAAADMRLDSLLRRLAYL